MDLDYPQPGFHFLVVFELLPQFPNDVRFQVVTVLTVSTEFEAWPEGGENRFAHQLPKSLQFCELVLKRGKFLGSRVLHWARKAMEQFQYTPKAAAQSAPRPHAHDDESVVQTCVREVLRILTDKQER